MIQKLIICLIIIITATIPSSIHLSFAQETSRQIVYSSSNGLFVMDIDSGEVIQLTGYDADNPMWSPDGQSVAYTSWNNGNGELDGEIYIVDIANGETIRLTDNSDSDFVPVWSPDGSQLVLNSMRDDGVELYLISPDGSTLQRLTFSHGSDDGASWSPDGKLLAFFSYHNGTPAIKVMNVQNDSFQVKLVIPNSDNLTMDAPTWSPDGSQIAFISMDNNHVAVADIQSGTVQKLTSTISNADPVWSPDGMRIAFVSHERETGSRNICVINVDGTNETCLTDDISKNFNPEWSPDGSQIAFISDRDGNQEIYLIDVNGANLTRLTNTPFADEEDIDWRPPTSTVAIKAPPNANDAGLPRVTAFDVQPRDISTGDTVTITWKTTDADLVCIQAVYFTRNEPPTCYSSATSSNTDTMLYADTQDYLEDSWIMPPQGTIILEVSEDRLEGFRVLVYSTNGYLDNTFRLHADLHVNVNPICEFERLDGASTPCPDEPVREIPAAYQPFQNGGFMVWFDGQIFAVQGGNTDYGYLREDGWDGVEVYTSDEPVPNGMQVPQRGFGWFANEFPYYGFAIAPEIGYTAQIQFIRQGRLDYFTPDVYILTLPDGSLLYLSHMGGWPPAGYKFRIVDPATPTNTVDQALPTALPTNSPITPTVHCEGTPPSRIASGMVAYVTISPPGQVRENLRVRSTPNGDPVGSIEEGTQFIILDGPVCANGFTWWEIETLDGALHGWSAEGIAPDKYFIAPE